MKNFDGVSKEEAIQLATETLMSTQHTRRSMLRIAATLRQESLSDPIAFRNTYTPESKVKIAALA